MNTSQKYIPALLFISLLMFCAVAEAGEPKFRVQKLALDANESAAVADVNGNGKLDVIAGRNWYPNPTFVPRPLRHIEDWNGYVHANGDHAWDVNGNGRADVISMAFVQPQIFWYENPGDEDLAKGHMWKRHLLADTGGGSNEATFFHDIDDDGTPEFIINSWNPSQPVRIGKLGRDGEGKPVMTMHTIGPGTNGHGMGFGDLNGNGREDIIVGTGWYERPEGNPLETEWRFHADWQLPGASCPMIVFDVDGDGRNDIIWGKGHDYGLYWQQQLEPDADGKLQWKQHVIDESWSQAHALHMADITGDGELELITGKRKWAHNGNDPGANDPVMLYYYKWNGEKFTRHVIAENVGTGLQIRTADLTGNGKLDIVVAGKDGTFIVFNE